MPRTEGPDRSALAAAVAVLLAAIAVLAIVLDFGPFADDPQGFAETGDEICAAAHERFERLQREPPRTPADAAALTRQLAEIAEQELDEIKGLEAPDDVADDLARYLRARERGIDLLRRGAAAAEDGATGAYDELQAELARTQPARQRLAREVGFRQCSRPLTLRSD